MGRKKLHISNKERWGSIYQANFWAEVDEEEEEEEEEEQGNPLRQASLMLEQAVLNTAIQKGSAN